MKITRYTPIIHGPKTGLAMERAMVEDLNGKWINFDEFKIAMEKVNAIGIVFPTNAIGIAFPKWAVNKRAGSDLINWQECFTAGFQAGLLWLEQYMTEQTKWNNIQQQ